MNTNNSVNSTNYKEAEEQFCELMDLENLDERIMDIDWLQEPFEEALEQAVSDGFGDEETAREANLFLHRILYRINRLKLFWYDDLENYKNESSVYLSSIRSRVESHWQDWESSNQDLDSLKELPFQEAIRQRIDQDLDSPPNDVGRYFQNDLTESGYQRLIGIGSLDGLVEASQLSRVLGGVGNEIQSMLTRIFLEEYGGGRLPKKHSTFYSEMLAELEMDQRPEAYLDMAPWEVLANINMSFFLSERKQNFLRYVGALLYTEISVPSAFRNYSKAGKRLGLSDRAIGYWDVHIKEDQRHGQWMLEDVALPLAAMYGGRAWEIIWGYDQQRFLSGRAGEAIVRVLRKADCALE